MTPTPQQIAACEHVRDSSRNLAVRARAGTGKTTLLVKLTEQISRREKALAVAFNKSIAEELRARVPRHIDVKTLHGLGFAAIQRAWGRRLETDAQRQRSYAREVVPESPSWSHRTVVGTVCKLVSMAMGQLATTPDHVAEVMYEYGILADRGVKPEQYVDWAVQVIARSRAETSAISFDDMVFLPAIEQVMTGAYDVVFFDEAQDANPAQKALLLAAVRRGGKVVIVGDDRQCHPAGVLVRVASNRDVPIEQLAGRSSVMGWNRPSQKLIGGRPFQISERPYQGPILTIDVEGHSKSLPVTPNHKFLARWSDRTSNVCVTYLMRRDGFGYRVGWCKLFNTGRVKSLHLAHRALLEKADAVWILKIHDGRTDASVYESIVAAKYGLPTVTFEPVEGANHLTETAIGSIFVALREDNEVRGARALQEHGLDATLPLLPYPTHASDGPGLYRRGTYFVCYATNLIPRMMALPLGEGVNNWAPVSDVRRTPYEGPVYSLDVSKDHSYCANGIVTLNSIYHWRGAGIDAFDALIDELKAEVLPLTWTFRCPTRVVTLARCIVDDLEAAPGAPRGKIMWDAEQTFYDGVRPGEAVIARSNAALTKACMQILRRGVRAKVAGRDFGDTLAGIVERSQTASTVKFLEWLTPWVTEESERLVAAGKDDKAEELADSAEALRVLSEGLNSTTALRNKLDELFVESPGTDAVRLSTVHRAKGLQWGRVWLLESSFRLNSVEGENLYYVAVTRVLGKDAPGELRLVQNALRGGKIPPSIAKGLLGGETLLAWDDEDRGVLSPETLDGPEDDWGDR